MKALKLTFLADRFHLRKYGRPVIGDQYLAMNYGPVASNTKDLAEMTDFLGQDERDYASRFIEPRDKYTYVSKANMEERVLSASDREALDWAWQNFGTRDKFSLSEMSHGYPEWKRHEAALVSGTASRVPMSYRDFLREPDEGFDPCFDLTVEDKEALIDGVRERLNFQKLWD
jgi:hypothetical protein